MGADKMLELEVRGLKQAQNQMAATVRALQPDNAAGAAIQFATLGLHRYMTSIVRVDTGRLKNSLFPLVDGLTGAVITNVNYAPYEEARGGEHAFMTRTEDEQMPKIAEQTSKYFGTAIIGAWEQAE